jgi:hypothetical protein
MALMYGIDDITILLPSNPYVRSGHKLNVVYHENALDESERRTLHKVRLFTEFTDSTKKVIEGYKAYYNTHAWDLSIVPFGIDKKGTGCFLHINIPKSRAKTNFYPIAETEIESIISSVLQELRDTVGVSFTAAEYGNTRLGRRAEKAFLSSPIVKLHYFVQIPADEELHNYFSALGHVKLFQAGLEIITRADSPDKGSFYWIQKRNCNRIGGFIIYDKTKHIGEDEIKSMGISGRFLRFELRRERKANIESAFKIGTLGELYERPDAPRKGFITFIRTHLFKEDARGIPETVSADWLKNEFMLFKDRYAVNWRQRWRTADWFANHYDADSVREVLVRMDLPENLFDIDMKQPNPRNDLSLLQQIRSENPSGRTNGSYYRELKTKVFKALDITE